MDRTALRQLLRETESLVHRDEQNIVHQRGVIATLERAGQDASIPRAFLRRLESRQARHIADRNRLFKELADSD